MTECKSPHSPGPRRTRSASRWSQGSVCAARGVAAAETSYRLCPNSDPACPSLLSLTSCLLVTPIPVWESASGRHLKKRTRTREDVGRGPEGAPCVFKWVRNCPGRAVLDPRRFSTLCGACVTNSVMVWEPSWLRGSRLVAFGRNEFYECFYLRRTKQEQTNKKSPNSYSSDSSSRIVF